MKKMEFPLTFGLQKAGLPLILMSEKQTTFVS